MGEYWCKCGCKIKKSTNSGTTGNRKTAGCDGCPYRIPWTKVEMVDGSGWESVVCGQECRASQRLMYQTIVQGSWTDKLTMSIYSLDLDFLDRVSDWIAKTYPGGELSGHFDRTTMRSSEFSECGRYRMAISCAANKKGLAAKAALAENFFDRETKTRKYVTAEAEKAKVLADIEAGRRKAAACAAEAARAAVEAQKKGSKMKEKIYQDPAGILYRVGVTGEMGNADRQHLTIQRLATEPGSQWRKKPLANTWRPECRKEAQATLDTMAERSGWEPADEDLTQYCALGRPALIGDTPAELAPADGAGDVTARQAEAAEEAKAAANLARFGFSPWTIHYLHAKALVDTPDELTELCDFEMKAIEESCPEDWQKIKTFVDGAFDATDGPTSATPIVSLQLPARAMIILQREGIQTVEELQAKSNEEIMQMRDLGRKDYDAILQAIGRPAEEPAAPAQEYTPLPPAMYSTVTGNCYKVGVWEEGNSGDRYGIFVARHPDQGGKWERWPNSVVHGPEVDHPADLVQMALDQTAKKLGWDVYTDTTAPADVPDNNVGTTDLEPAAEESVTTPVFDYGVDPKTNEQLIQCAQTYMMGKMAMVMAVKRAHSLTANHKNGTFGKWCASVGISRDKGNQLVNIADNFGNIEIDGKPLVEIAPISLLAEAAKPSAPAVIRERVAQGDITTHKQYKQLEKELADAREALRQAEVGRDAAVKDVRQLEAGLAQDRAETDKEIAGLKQKHDEAFRAAHDFHVRAEKAEAECSALLDQQGEYIGKVQAMELELGSAKADAARMERMADDEIARMQQQVDDAEARARQAEAALKDKPVEVVGAATEDIERWRAEGALEGRQQAEEARRALSDSLYAMAETIRENTLTQLNTWKTAARGLSEEDYVQCVSVLQPIQKKIMAMCAEHLPK